MNLYVILPTIVTLVCVSVTDLRTRRVPRILIAIGWITQVLTLVGHSLLCTTDTNSIQSARCAVLVYSHTLMPLVSHTIQIQAVLQTLCAALLGSICCAGIQLLCALMKPGTLGMGDVNVTAVIGLTLGVCGLETAVYWWLLSGICGLIHLCCTYICNHLQYAYNKRHTQLDTPYVPLSIPFVPDLTIAYMLVVFLILL